MNEMNAEHERIERLLEQSHVPKPSDQLKSRVVVSAQQAWEQSTADISWRVPFKRLALSAAAAVFIVSLANHFSNFGAPETCSSLAPMKPAEMRDLETLPEAIHSPLMIRIVQTGHRSIRTNAPALRNHLENTQRILNEMEDNETGETPASNGSRSRLHWRHPGLGTYS